MNEQQQELYEKLLKKVNEYCLGYAAEDVIEVIDALVDNYERVNHLPKDKYKVARELLNDTSPLQALNNIANIEMKEQYKIDKGGFAYRVVSDEYSKELIVIETELKNAEKNKKVLKEIIDLYGEWLGYRKSDFEFFTLLQEIVCKNELLKEILK